VDLAMTAAPPRDIERPRLATLAIYGTGIGLSAFLLFSVEPLVGRLALPVFGGVPAAWATVLAFFQGILLLGYLYSHVSVTRLGVRRGAVVHVGVAVAAFALLLAAPADWAPLRDASIPPGLNLLAILAVTVGPAAFLLTATTPLLSAWYAAVRDAETPGAVDPYWLYALSNGASLAALLAYPLVVEPALGLTAQRSLWAAALGLFVAIVAAAALRVFVVARPPGGPPVAAGPAETPVGAIGAQVDRIDGRRRLRWFVLAAIPTGLLMAVTTFIATDLVSAPLLWVGPLAIYLASFVVAFSGRGGTLVRWATICAPAAATLLWVPLGSSGIWPLVPLVAVELGGYAVVATALHGRLAADRPAARHLTEFYLVLALAGVIAGCFVAFVAPAVFPDVWEYPLLVGSAVAAFVLTMPPALRAARRGQTRDEPHRGSRRRALDFSPFVAGLRGRLGPYLVVAVLLSLSLVGQGPLAFQAGTRWLLVGGLLLLLGGVPRFFALSTAVVLVLAVLVLPPTPLFRDRSYFGVTIVLQSPDGERMEILNGTTLHGVQFLDDARRARPATYYVEEGPIGDVFRRLRAQAAPATGAGRSVGIVGLGAGGLAAYGRAGDRWTYFEIDPVVVRVAEDPAYFTYLRDAPARPEVVVGDGRLELERVADGAHDLLVLDAFSSDAIPVHLLTVEALRDALRTVAPGGLLAVHVSNRYYDLAPAVAAAARDLGLAALRSVYAPTPAGEEMGAIGSIWMVLARDPGLLVPLADAGWGSVPVDGIAAITDDRPDILRFLFLWDEIAGSDW
jgi:SAM-dependent methyltransferase